MKAFHFRSRITGAALAAAFIFASAIMARAECNLNSPSGAIKHVVYVEFDNVHFTRDNPNVPSDLEQMPNLLNFLKGKGTLDAGDHTVLISHTANGILTTQTGYRLLARDAMLAHFRPRTLCSSAHRIADARHA